MRCYFKLQPQVLFKASLGLSFFWFIFTFWLHTNSDTVTNEIDRVMEHYSLNPMLVAHDVYKLNSIVNKTLDPFLLLPTECCRRRNRMVRSIFHRLFYRFYQHNIPQRHHGLLGGSGFLQLVHQVWPNGFSGDGICEISKGSNCIKPVRPVPSLTSRERTQ